eukprot:TRINITY_DN1020_c0_g1_i1.p1 TRINITY_DN1020_c0_g1~~TRINITY_DN1020_c0_g1_i1.p1  ORF type:complete len:593 (+),score=135.15 TRINITY_DN1020_c0_g1_i1:39-1781(+)
MVCETLCSWGCSLMGFLLQPTVLLVLVAAYIVKTMFIKEKIPHRAPLSVKDYPEVKFDGEVLECINPASGEVLGSVTAASPANVLECVRLARIAQIEWAKTSFAERRAVLADLMQAVLDNQDEICRLSSQDTGKTTLEATYGEILTTCEKLRHLVAKGESALQSESRTPPLLLMVKKAWVEYHPLGVIGTIVPWNYPFHNVASAVASSIFSGNAAVVKVSEFACFSRPFFQTIFSDVLAKRGHNPHLVQLMTGCGDTGEALVRSGADKILFIGSPQVGKLVMKAAADSLTPVTLELGGKDAFVVCEDSDYEHAVDVAMRGVFVNCGQNCIAAERVFVHDAIYEKFADEMATRVGALRQGCALKGDGCDLGSMCMEKQVNHVEMMVQQGIDDGATLIAGGKRDPTRPEGLFFQPTVLRDVTPDNRIAMEEVFGPVMLLIRFKTDDELIVAANQTKYALGCSVFSSDYKRAESIASRIVSGMVVINDYGVGYLIQALPFGGCKYSGFGRFNGPEGLREFSRQKSVVTDRFGAVARSPPFVQFPIPRYAPSIVKQAIKMIYEASPLDRVRALATFLKHLIKKE